MRHQAELEGMIRATLDELLRRREPDTLGASICAHIEKVDHSGETPRLVEEVSTENGTVVAVTRHATEGK